MTNRMMAAVIAALVLTAVAAASALAQGSPSTVSGQDQNWLKTSAQGDVFEIQGGKLALQKGRSPSVKALAQRLIKDHTKSLADAKKLASKLNVRLESSPTPSEQWELQVVASFSGTQFDHWYSTLEVKDHQQDIQETTDELKLGSNADVRAEARKDLPMLRMHLSLARKAMRGS
jgi:putative membrane protein